MLKNAISLRGLHRKGKEQSRNAQAKIKFAGQGIPFAQLVQTQLDFPKF